MGSEQTKSTMDVSSINLENVRGMVVGLSSREVFWRPEFGTGKVDLNRMTGAISFRVGNDLNDYEAMSVINGLRSGRLIVLEKEVKGEPMRPINAGIQSDELVAARRMLDEKDVNELERAVEKAPRRIVEACLELEKAEGNRAEVLDIIKNRLRLD